MKKILLILTLIFTIITVPKLYAIELREGNQKIHTGENRIVNVNNHKIIVYKPNSENEFFTSSGSSFNQVVFLNENGTIITTDFNEIVTTLKYGTVPSLDIKNLFKTVQTAITKIQLDVINKINKLDALNSIEKLAIIAQVRESSSSSKLNELLNFAVAHNTENIEKAKSNAMSMINSYTKLSFVQNQSLIMKISKSNSISQVNNITSQAKEIQTGIENYEHTWFLAKVMLFVIVLFFALWYVDHRIHFIEKIKK